MKFTALKNIHHQRPGSSLVEFTAPAGRVVELDENDGDVKALVDAHALAPVKAEPKAEKPKAEK